MCVCVCVCVCMCVCVLYVFRWVWCVYTWVSVGIFECVCVCVCVRTFPIRTLRRSMCSADTCARSASQSITAPWISAITTASDRKHHGDIVKF